MSDLSRERYRRDDRRAAPISPPASGTPAMLVQVYDAGSIPTALNKFYACHPAQATGAETEGGTGTPSVDTGQTVFVYFVGSKAPAANEYHVAKYVDYRWVAERMQPSGPPPVNLFACNGCTAVPQALHLSSADPTKNFGRFPDTDLTYQLYPPGWTGGTPDVWFSPGSFISNFGSGNRTYYLTFRCEAATGFTVRIYFWNDPSNGADAGNTGVVQFRYTVGTGGNACTGSGTPTPPYTLDLPTAVYAGGLDSTQHHLIRG